MSNELFCVKTEPTLRESEIETLSQKQLAELLRQDNEKTHSFFENSQSSVPDVWARTFDAISDIVTTQDRNLIIIRANKAAREFFQLNKDDLQGKHCYEIFTGKPEPCPNCPLLATLSDGSEHSSVIKHEKLDKVLQVTSSLIPANDNEEEYLMHVARDITTDIEKDKNLQESSERFLKAFEANPAPMVISDIESGLFIDVNQRWIEMLGYSRHELVGKTSKEVGIWKDPVARDRAVAKLSTESSFRDYQIEFTTKSGELCLALWSAEKITINGRELMLSLINDITEQQKAETERNRLIAAVEQTLDAIVITDKEANIQYVNPAFEAITGYTRSEVLNQNPSILKSDEHDQHFYQEMWQNLKHGKTFKSRMVNRRKDGSLFTEEATISPILDCAGEIVNFVAVKRDITDQILLEAQLQQAQKMEAVGLLTGGVAHDFNNILGVIIGYTEMALDKIDSSQKLHGDLTKILDAAERSADIVRQLLAFSRKQTISPRVLDLNAAVTSMLKILHRLIGEAIDLSWIPEPDTLLVKMDPTQIDQVLANLCVNAKDAIDSTGKITIETTTVTFDEEYCACHVGFHPGKFVQLSISDNGCGIEKEAQNRIFEPFFSTKELGQGTGLGLSTVYGIVKQNNGFINVYSEIGRGTTFKIYLPSCDKGHLETSRKATMKSKKSLGETVLLVEDEPVMLEMAQQMLERLGYIVLQADRPSEAIKIAKENLDTIDLILTDMVMPEMTGKDMVRLIEPLHPEIKVLNMSGYTANVIAHNGILDEGVHFIQKPFSMKELGAKLREVLVG